MILCVLCAVAACGDDPVSVDPFLLSGAWTYSAPGLTGLLPENPQEHPNFRNIAATCSVAPTAVVLSGSAGTFGGSYRDLALTCGLLNAGSTHLGTPGRQVATVVLGPAHGKVEDGSQVGDGVIFSFSPGVEAIIGWTNEGEADSNIAGGEVRITAILGGEIVELTGRWTATRD